MNPLKLMSILLFLTFVNTFSQSTIPQKKDNLVVIVDEQSPDENFTKFGKFLIEKGFSIESKDKEFMTMSTGERTSKGGYKYILNISFKDSIISIRPKCISLGISGSTGSSYNTETIWVDWSYAKSKHSPVGIAYKAFYPILQEYKKPIYFYKE